MRSSIRSLLVAALAAASVVVAGGATAGAEVPPSTWEVVTTIPNAEDGFFPQRIWTGEPGVVYALTARTTPTHDVALLRWDGAWSVELDLPGQAVGALFGTGPADIYAGVYTCEQPSGTWSCPGTPDALGNKLFHFDGVGWTEETLPAATADWRLSSIGGVPGEIHVGVGPYIVRKGGGGGWTVIYDAGGGITVWPTTMTFVAADEAYTTSCWGHAAWDGVTWTKKVEFDFCDENDIFGARDEAGDLHLWVVGNNNFSNGVRIWKYDEPARSFGSKFGFEFGDPPGYEGQRQGNARGIWGASWDDVYVTGSRWTAAHPYPGYPEGRIYHNDGTGWTQLTIPTEETALDVWGTGHDDVWFSLRNGDLLHLGVLDTDDDPSLILDYDLTQDPPVAVIDRANGVVATPHGTVWTTDPSGTPVLYFDNPIRYWFGDGDYMEIPNDAGLDAESMTIEALVYPMSTGYYTSFAEQIRDGGTFHHVVYLGFAPTGYTTGQQPQFVLAIGGEYHQLIAPDEIPLNAWSRIVGTYDGNDMNLYVDGALVASLPDVGGPRDTSSNPLYLGHAPTSNHYFNGYYGAFKMYDRALTAAEIGGDPGQPPETTIVVAPPDPSGSANASFVFTGTDDLTVPGDLAFECQLDGAGFAACVSPHDDTGLADGTHTFEVRATDQAGNTDPTPAAHTWLVDTTAASDPPTFELWWGPGVNDPYGVAVDGSGNVYVTGQYSVRKFDGSGGLLTSWGSPGTANGKFLNARGIAVDGSGNVYVADRGNHRIQKFTSDGAFVTTWGTFGWGLDGEFQLPSGVAVDASGNVYVADGNNQIQKFTSDGVFLTKWGTSGAGNGQFDFPLGVAVDASGNVYVADASNHRIQKFTSDGVFLTTWGSYGSADGQFRLPHDVAVDAWGNVYVADRNNHRIQKFTSDGAFLTKWGSYGSGPGFFDNPSGVAVNDWGDVYIVDAQHRVHKYAYANDPPETTIVVAPPDPSASADVGFEFTGTDDLTVPGDLAFECQLDGAGFAACVSPHGDTGLSDGTHTFEVRATDQAGNTDATPASFTWLVDTIAPIATATATPAANANGWNNTDVTVTFTGDDGTGSGIAFCDPDIVVSTEGAAQDATGTCTDLAGNTSTPASVTISIDKTPPETTIVVAPPDPSASADAGFEFTGTDDLTVPGDLAFECQLDGAGFAACVSPHGDTGLSDGTHTFEVRATDQAGNTDATPASFTWLVDTIAPIATATATPAANANGWNNTDVTVTFTGDDGTGSGIAFCDPDIVVSTEGAAQDATGTCTDLAGNTSTPASVTISIDKTPPETTIVVAPPDPSASADAGFEFTGTDDLTVPGDLAFECQLDGAGFAACVSPHGDTGLSDGTHTFEVRATDQAGNTDATPASFTWLVDTIAPIATATATPVANANGWNNTDVTVTFTGDDGTGSGIAFCDPDIVVSTEGAAQDATGTCTDLAGNTSTPASVTISIDKTPPTMMTMDVAVMSTVEVAVTYPAPVVTDALDPAPAVSCVPTSGSVFTVGDTTVTCTATDAAGNAGHATFVVSVLTTASVIQDVIDEIDVLLADPGISRKAADELAKAQDKLYDALDELAETPSDVRQALNRVGDAVRELGKAGQKGADVVAAIDQLIEISRVTAQDAIDMAVADGGDDKEIDRALTEMTNAQQDLGDDRPDKAIDHHAKAWDHARKA